MCETRRHTENLRARMERRRERVTRVLLCTWLVSVSLGNEPTLTRDRTSSIIKEREGRKTRERHTYTSHKQQLTRAVRAQHKHNLENHRLLVSNSPVTSFECFWMNDIGTRHLKRIRCHGVYLDQHLTYASILSWRMSFSLSLSRSLESLFLSFR